MRLSEKMNSTEGILQASDIKQKQCHCAGVYVSFGICYWNDHTVSLELGMNNNNKKVDFLFNLKWEDKVRYVLAIFMFSHRPHNQEAGRLGSSKDKETKIDDI